jgi:hypothetical protein
MSVSTNSNHRPERPYEGLLYYRGYPQYIPSSPNLNRADIDQRLQINSVGSHNDISHKSVNMSQNNSFAEHPNHNRHHEIQSSPIMANLKIAIPSQRDSTNPHISIKDSRLDDPNSSRNWHGYYPPDSFRSQHEHQDYSARGNQQIDQVGQYNQQPWQSNQPNHKNNLNPLEYHLGPQVPNPSISSRNERVQENSQYQEHVSQNNTHQNNYGLQHEQNYTNQIQSGHNQVQMHGYHHDLPIHQEFSGQVAQQSQVNAGITGNNYQNQPFSDSNSASQLAQQQQPHSHHQIVESHQHHSIINPPQQHVEQQSLAQAQKLPNTHLNHQLQHSSQQHHNELNNQPHPQPTHPLHTTLPAQEQPSESKTLTENPSNSQQQVNQQTSQHIHEQMSYVINKHETQHLTQSAQHVQSVVVSQIQNSSQQEKSKSNQQTPSRIQQAIDKASPQQAHQPLAAHPPNQLHQPQQQQNLLHSKSTDQHNKTYVPSRPLQRSGSASALQQNTSLSPSGSHQKHADGPRKASRARSPEPILEHPEITKSHPVRSNYIAKQPSYSSKNSKKDVCKNIEVT